MRRLSILLAAGALLAAQAQFFNLFQKGPSVNTDVTGKARLEPSSVVVGQPCAILLELDPHDGPAAPQYLRLLGFRDSARPLLRAIRDRAILPVITKPGHDPAPLGEDARAERLWSLGAGRPDNLFRQSPVIYYTDKEST